MRGYATWSALLLVGLLGCSDSVEKESPVVIDLNNLPGNNTPDNNTPDNNTPDNNTPDNNTPDNNTPDNNTPDNNTPDPTLAYLDLRVDTNRDGVVDFDDPTDDQGEETWNSESGAVFLPNIDDDSIRCPRTGSDASLASCFDAADEIVNGPEDLLDMAPIKLRATGTFPDTATARIGVEGAEHVRFFREVASEWTAIDLANTNFTAQELRDGVDLRMEGKDILRNPNGWDGKIRLTATMDGAPEGSETTDIVEMMQAPLVLRHHLDPVTEMFTSEMGIGGDGAFTRDLNGALTQLNLGDKHYELPVQDQWTQDFFENAYLKMPGPNGPQTIQVYIRSANVEYSFGGRLGLREAGRAVYESLRGPNRAGVTQYTSQRSLEWDTLNSFGNTEVIPPHAGYPLGRIIRGQAPGDRGDSQMLALFDAQRIQTPLFVDTSWLLVAHIDETVSFIKDDTAALGWSMLANDATYAVQILDTIAQQGGNQITMFQGKRWVSDFGQEYSAAVSVGNVLQDPDVMAASAEAAIEVNAQVNAIKSATGLTDADIIKIPFTHMNMGGASIAHQPGIVNGIVIDGNNFFAPKPYGPRVQGADVLEAATEERLAARGYSVKWIEDWDMYHRLAGEIHCASNVTRAIPADTRWWEVIQ